MNIRPIKTEQDYNFSIHRIKELWGAKMDTPEGDELDLLVTLVESYETSHENTFSHRGIEDLSIPSIGKRS